MGKAAVILVLGTIFTFVIINMNSTEKMNRANDNSIGYFSDVNVRNICNSAVGSLISKLADDNEYRVEQTASMEYKEGQIDYTIKDTVISSQDLIEIYVNGEYNGQTDVIVAYVQLPENGFVPAAVKAAVSTNNTVITTGNIEIDGREHDINGNLIPNSGTLGIWTTQTYTQSGSSTVGGTSGGADYTPSHPGAPNVIETGAIYPGGYPDSPDKALGGEDNGFPEGTLKSLAKSGANGSQYTADPSTLKTPFKGITYVEIAEGETWKPDITGSGILIIHNSTSNSTIREVHGTFTGLLIFDLIDKTNGTTVINGAMIGLGKGSSTLENADPNTFGNGNAQITYSSEALKLATKGLGGNTDANYGFGQYRLKVVSWYEKK